MPFRTLLLILLLAVVLTILFWGPLWQGYGLIGGDLYSYFFPQKAVFADQLGAGEWPLWNPLVGFGYPSLAESQTGVCYPPNWPLYRLLNLNTAYNVSQLSHYVAAFVFTWLLMRRLDLSGWGATLAAVVFVYGWFPPRICLEWAIIGGVYLPLSLWCVESYLQTHRQRWLLLLTAALALHMLSGHFNLAFITQLTLVLYTVLRVSWPRRTEEGLPTSRHRTIHMLLPLVVAVTLGFLLAGIQLLPTWELKQLSQRENVGALHDPGYGHLPPWYLSQIVAPWWWYPDDMDPDQALQSIHFLSIDSNTNKVEAHLYFGLLPVLLILGRLLWVSQDRMALDRRHFMLLLLGLAAMVYTTGWLLPVTRHLPGFSFFMGPGRWGIVTTLAAAVLAGSGADLLVSRRRRPTRLLLMLLVLGLTLGDLWWVSRQVTYATMVESPPLNHRDESDVRQVLSRSPRLVRMWAPGPNLASLTGFNTVPVYLGLGPAAYYDQSLMVPRLDADQLPPGIDRHTWLRNAGVTHLLSMEPLVPSQWSSARLIWQGFDQLLSPAWARFHEPLFLYELPDSLPRVRLIDPQPGDDVRVIRYDATHVIVEATTVQGGLVLLADLDYPGWSATRDGIELPPVPGYPPFRVVDIPPGRQTVEWSYAPGSLLRGAALSALGLTAWIGWLIFSLYRRRTA